MCELRVNTQYYSKYTSIYVNKKKIVIRFFSMNNLLENHVNCISRFTLIVIL